MPPNCRSFADVGFHFTISWVWQQCAKCVSIFVFWRKSLFWIDCIARELNPAVAERSLHVHLQRAPISSQTHRRELIHPWLRVLGSHSSNTKGILDDILLPGTTKRAAGWLDRGTDGDVSPLFSRDRWPITAYYRLFPHLQHNLFPVICTVTRAFLKHRYWHMYTHPHSISFMHTHTHKNLCSCYIREASSKIIKEAPSFCTARLQPKKRNMSDMLDVTVWLSNSSYWCVSSLKCLACVHLFVTEGCNVNVRSSCASDSLPHEMKCWRKDAGKVGHRSGWDGSGKGSKQRGTRDTWWKMQVKEENVGRWGEKMRGGQMLGKSTAKKQQGEQNKCLWSV